MENNLTSCIEAAGAISIEDRDAMYQVYARHYEATCRQRFESDLANKSHVVQLRDANNRIKGFTTLARYIHQLTPDTGSEECCRNHNQSRNNSEQSGSEVQIIFSGDTIVEPQYWGKQTMQMAWLEQCGRFKALHPELPLYWFLIVKGYRTYRFLPVFFNEYFPAFNSSGDQPLKKLLDQLASDRFGGSYHPESGRIIFPQSLGHLNDALAEIPARVRNRPEVEFFINRNPGFRKGDELACIVELSSQNLKRRTRSVFERGMAG